MDISTVLTATPTIPGTLWLDHGCRKESICSVHVTTITMPETLILKLVTSFIEFETVGPSATTFINLLNERSDNTQKQNRFFVRPM